MKLLAEEELEGLGNEFILVSLYLGRRSILFIICYWIYRSVLSATCVALQHLGRLDAPIKEGS